MKAVVCSQAQLEVVERPEPVPGHGQVRLEVLRCGICGSDLHARHGVDAWADLAARAGYDRFARSEQQIVFGHEFCGQVAEHGPGCRKGSPAGTRVVALPLLRGPQGVDTVGLSAHAPGAYAEQLLVQESLMMPVPNGLGPEVAALTEPMAVAWHAVRRGEVRKRSVAIVIGCGPVGLAVILLLKAKGVRTVVASDLSPGRRALAGACGADVVIDPAHE
ncbi:MAG TPA: alcohol dehydrogenase catalytic domain-containing protein, partial [Thermoleophilaceae bacterium]|nr:alcohol dehydrogenase catalytic domain-containing protein [Thermoleophilaceae bacterium]